MTISLTPSPNIMDVEGCPLPEDRFYDLEQDAWFLFTKNPATGRIGLLGPHAWFLGRVTQLTYRPTTSVLERGKSIATIETVRATAPFRLPVSAEVTETNRELEARPKLVNDSPYDRGWVAEIHLSDPAEPALRLESADQIRERLARRIRERRIRCFPAMPDLEMYEIGAECVAILAKLDEELARRPAEDVIHVVTDDPTSPIEMVRWTDRTGHSVIDHRAEGGLHHFLIRKEAIPIPRPRPV